MHPLSHRKHLEIMNRDVAQLVSAPALGAGGPPFESEYPDELDKKAFARNCKCFFLLPPLNEICTCFTHYTVYFHRIVFHKKRTPVQVPFIYLSGRRLHKLLQQVSHANLLVNSLVKLCNWNSLLLHGVTVA